MKKFLIIKRIYNGAYPQYDIYDFENGYEAIEVEGQIKWGYGLIVKKNWNNERIEWWYDLKSGLGGKYEGKASKEWVEKAMGSLRTEERLKSFYTIFTFEEFLKCCEKKIEKRNLLI